MAHESKIIMDKDYLKFEQDKIEFDAFQIIQAYLDNLNEEDAKKLIEILIQKTSS